MAGEQLLLSRAAEQLGLDSDLRPAHVFVAGAVIFGLIAYLFSCLKAIQSPLQKIPGPWYAPLTTVHLKVYFARGTIWKYVQRCHAKYGPIVRLGPRQIWVADREAMKDILVSTDLPKVTMYAEISRERTSPGLFGEIRPEPHRKLKMFLGPAFTISAVDKLDNFFKACVAGLLENYYEQMANTSIHGPKAKFKTDLMRDLHCLALDIMGQSSFGRGFGQIDKVFDPSRLVTRRDKEWSKIPNAIFDGLARRYQMVFVKRFLRGFGCDLKFGWPKDMTKAISTLIDERREGDESVNSHKYDVLQHMLDEGNRPDTGKRMNNQDIIDQMSELLLAGSETTSGTIGCLFLEIARNKEVREKLLKSLPVLRPEDPILDSKTVREGEQYRYLEACIKENLRMHPIASEMGRRNPSLGYFLCGYEVPAHTVVSASYRCLHLNEEHWPQPHRFWPERWLDESEMEGAPPPDMDAYYPFSGGKHSCIGKNFAYAEIRTVSANILSRFYVEEVEKQAVDFRQYITMQFTTGKWRTTLTPRWESS